MCASVYRCACVPVCARAIQSPYACITTTQTYLFLLLEFLLSRLPRLHSSLLPLGQLILLLLLRLFPRLLFLFVAYFQLLYPAALLARGLALLGLAAFRLWECA